MQFNIGPIIKPYLVDNSNDSLNDYQLAKLIFQNEKQELPQNYTFNACRLAVTYYRKKNQSIEINPEEQPTQPLQTPCFVQDDEYTFNAQKGTFSLSVAFIDNLFYEYSEHGLDLQSTELIRKYSLEPWQWFAIKNALRLYKKSHIFSPYTVQITPSDQIQQMVDEKMEKLTKDINHQVVKSYNKAIYKGYKDSIKKLSQKDLELETIITDLYDLLKESSITPEVPITIDRSGDEISVFIADIHFGVLNDSKSLTPYSPEILEEIFDKIANIINLQKASKVNIFLAGDYFEAISALNHLNSFRNMAHNSWGAGVIKDFYQFLVRFINKVNNVVKIFGVEGNHDRISANKNENPDGDGAEIVFEFLKVIYKDKIEVIFEKRILSQEIDDIQIIMSHGHEKISQQNGANLVLEYGNANKFNLIISAHFHQRQIKADNQQYRQITLPSILPGNSYSQGAGFSPSQSGIVIVKNNGFGKPVLIDYSL